MWLAIWVLPEPRDPKITLRCAEKGPSWVGILDSGSRTR